MSSLLSGGRNGTLALPPFLRCPRCVRLPSALLFNGPFTRPGFFGILCLVASHLVCRQLFLRRQAPLVLLALLGNGPRLLLLASLARRGRITRTSAVSSSPGGSGCSGVRRKVQGRSQPVGTTLLMRMLSGLPPLWRQCLIMGQSWVVVVLRDDYCVPFKDSSPSLFSHPRWRLQHPGQALLGLRPCAKRSRWGLPKEPWESPSVRVLALQSSLPGGIDF